MEGRGGCCIAKLSGGHVAAYDSSNINRIMMRFRPIAPKPAPNSPATSSSDTVGGHAKAAPTTARGRGRKKCTPRRKRKSWSPDPTAEITQHHHHHDHQDHRPVVKAAVTTLPLLPEAPDLSPTSTLQPRLVVDDNYNQSHSKVFPDRAATVPPRHERIVASYVIVEGITDTWTDDHQAMMMKSVRLEEDKCPGLITDAWHRVWWTNEAYRRMVMIGQGEDTCQDQKMGVWVMMREKVPDALQAFTCRVRVQRNSHGNDTTGSSTMTLPCDVWRIDGGGWFAWRLDVDAALSLGR